MKPNGFKSWGTKSLKRHPPPYTIMGQQVDFHLKSPECLTVPGVEYKDEERALTWAMFAYALLEPIASGKNVFVLVTGRSREGKSATVATIIEELMSRQGLKLKDYVHDIFIYTPFEYQPKMQALLDDKRLKDIHFAVLDDARFTVSSKNWHSVINRSIADISSISGRKKPIVFFICTQFLSDIDKDMRRFLNYWGSVYRPLHKPAQLKLFAFWTDERDPENVKLRKRAFKGIVVDKGRYVPHVPTQFIFHMPSKETWAIYDEASFKAKSKLLQSRFDKLMTKLQKDAGLDNRVDRMIEFYSQPDYYEHIMSHFTYKYKKLKLKPKSFDILKLNKIEAKEFTEKLAEKLRFTKKKRMEVEEDVPKEEFAD